MDMNNVVLEIMSEAEKAAKQVLDEAGAERRRLLDEARDRADAQKAAMSRDAEERIAQMRSSAFARNRMEAKRIEMDARKEAVEDFYARFAEALYESVGREHLLKKLHAIGSKQITPAAVYVSQDDMKIAAKLFDKVKAAPIAGGIIIENAGGTERVDLSLETLIEMLARETLSDVTKIIFGGN